MVRLQQFCSTKGTGLQLPLPVVWAGKSGLGFPRARAKLIEALEDAPSPSYVVLHVGGNDVCRVDQKHWREELDELVCFVRAFCPKATVVWSDMLPRNSWRHESFSNGGENSRKKLNRKARGRIMQEKEKGRIVYHPNFDHSYLAEDGVHLSTKGLDQFKADFELQLTAMILG